MHSTSRRAIGERTLYSAYVHRRHQETNFDPDDGIDRDIAGEDISDRFSYVSDGLEAEFRHQLARIGWNLEMRAELRDYDEVPIVDDFDHAFVLIGGNTWFPVTRSTSIRFGIDYYYRDISPDRW